MVPEYNKPVIPRKDVTLKYEYFSDVTHPLASKGGKVYYHRHVASLKVGHWLLPEECVHHIDGNKLNNDPDNLEVLSQAEHAHGHAVEKYRDYVQKPRKSRAKDKIKDFNMYLPPNFCNTCHGRTYNKTYCSYECSHLSSRKVERPSKEVLAQEIAEMSWLALSRKYGVSDNAIRKWARSYGLIC